MPARYLQELLCKGNEYHWRPQVTYTHGQWNVVLPHGPWSPQSHLALCKSGRNNSGTYNVLKIRLLRGRVSSHTCSSHIQLDQEVLSALKLIACWCWRLLATWVNQPNVDGTTIYPVVVTPICALLRAATDWGQSKITDCVTSVLSLWPWQKSAVIVCRIWRNMLSHTHAYTTPTSAICDRISERG